MLSRTCEHKSCEEIVCNHAINDAIKTLEQLRQSEESALLSRVKSLIQEERDLPFSKDIPVFDNLADYMEYSVKLRRALRKELLTKLDQLSKENRL